MLRPRPSADCPSRLSAICCDRTPRRCCRPSRDHSAARWPVGGRTAGGNDLTATEQRVATLVAEGRTNREVASELVVSVRAVEANLTRVYAKLGVRSRAELAARCRG